MNTTINDNEKAIIEKHNRILSTISHDLKSPMIAMLGFSRILFREIETSGIRFSGASATRKCVRKEQRKAMALVYTMPIYLLRSTAAGSAWTNQYVMGRHS